MPVFDAANSRHFVPSLERFLFFQICWIANFLISQEHAKDRSLAGLAKGTFKGVLNCFWGYTMRAFWPLLKRSIGRAAKSAAFISTVKRLFIG